MNQNLKPASPFAFLRNFVLALLVLGLYIVIMDAVAMHVHYNRSEQHKEHNMPLDSDDAENAIEHTK